MSEKNHPCQPPPHRVTIEFATVDLVHCNAAFSSGNFIDTIAHFSNAITLARMNLVLYSNQSAAYASLHKYFEALTDAKKTPLRSAWDKKGLEIDPNNEPLKFGLDDAQSAASRSRAHLPASPFRDASSGPEMWSKLIADPTTRPYLQQHNFMRLIVMQALGVLLNAKLKGKVVGNVAYKNKDFDTSIQHYSKAIELDDEDISYIMNRAGTYLEMSKTDRAVEIRRELRSDFKMIPKALTRKGTALVKLSKCSKDDEPAIETFQNALTEHRNPETLKKLNDAEKAKKELEQQEYFDLQKADEEREKASATKHGHVSFYRNTEACWRVWVSVQERAMKGSVCLEPDPEQCMHVSSSSRGTLGMSSLFYGLFLDTGGVPAKGTPTVKSVHRVLEDPCGCKRLAERSKFGQEHNQVVCALRSLVNAVVIFNL
ncbi:hypothetical protein UlMin_012483 [Ulmus minor]